MPELPEVETTKNGLAPFLTNAVVTGLDVHDSRLRWPVPEELPEQMTGQPVVSLTRRAKYIIVSFATGHLLIHLGMSGSLRVVKRQEVLRKHDHVVLHLASEDDAQNETLQIRYHDPRRFGAWVWTTEDWRLHKLIAHLGPEPLSDNFDASYLHARARGRKTPIKTFIMDATQVVGVGNIYANEALFMAGIRPTTQAARVSKLRMERLVGAIKTVLADAIVMGGTTLRDFVNADNNPGYFQQTLLVYGREGEACVTCAKPLKSLRMSNRATVYCSTCQR